MTADLGFDDGRTGRISCALLSARLLRLGAHVRGTQGVLRVNFPFLPHIFHHIRVEMRDAVRHERVAGAPTYQHQLAAFTDAALHGAPFPTDAADAVYQAAGLRGRGEG